MENLSDDFIYIPPQESTPDMPIDEQIKIEINKAIESLRDKFPQYLFGIDYIEYRIDNSPSEPIILNDLWLDNLRLEKLDIAIKTKEGK